MVVVLYFFLFFFKQKTAYEMRISDWSSDVCSSDLGPQNPYMNASRIIGAGARAPLSQRRPPPAHSRRWQPRQAPARDKVFRRFPAHGRGVPPGVGDSTNAVAETGSARGRFGKNSASPGRPRRRSDEHTSELQSLMRTPYAVS